MWGKKLFLSDSKECIICHYWFFNHEFGFQDYFCNRCHGLANLCFNISNITFFDYCCIVNDMRYKKVVLNGQFSGWAAVNAGVSEVSILGPLLFLVYINDLSIV